MVENSEAPTTRYSTLFEFNNSTNSRKSLLSGIWMATVPKFDGDANALFQNADWHYAAQSNLALRGHRIKADLAG
jgi:hypothetical protein